jgi:hypothetical protein
MEMISTMPIDGQISKGIYRKINKITILNIINCARFEVLVAVKMEFMVF